MTYDAHSKVQALALEQHGVFTAGQATTLGVNKRSLVTMAARGHLERLAHGLYRDTRTPETRWTPYMRAVLWPYRTPAVLSHETVLALMELSDVNPSAIHISVPRLFRTKRTPPPGVIVHRQDLTEADIASVEGLPTTTAARAIRDCAMDNLGPALIRQALADAQQKGWVTTAEAEHLRHDLVAAGKLAA
jgi:predicted transcriptional regulator of viral defense system